MIKLVSLGQSRVYRTCKCREGEKSSLFPKTCSLYVSRGNLEPNPRVGLHALGEWPGVQSLWLVLPHKACCTPCLPHILCYQPPTNTLFEVATWHLHLPSSTWLPLQVRQVGGGVSEFLRISTLGTRSLGRSPSWTTQSGGEVDIYHLFGETLPNVKWLLLW